MKFDSIRKTFGNFFTKIKEVSVSWSTFGGSENSVTQGNLIEADKNWVSVCVDKNAISTASVELRLMRYNKKNGEEIEIYDHPALDLLQKPNPQFTETTLRYITTAHLELTGNAYWLKDKPQNPTKLFPLNPKDMTVKYNEDMSAIVSYKYRMGAKIHDYQPDMIFHLKYPNPRNPIVGRGKLEPVAEWVDVDNYATDYNRRFFINGATPGGMIESDATSKETLELIRLGIEGMHKGAKNAHKIGVLPKGAKWAESKMTPKDMEFSNADARFRDKILAAFGVPKSVLGIVEDVNRANADSSNYVFMAFTIKPKIDNFVNFLNEFYLASFNSSDTLYFKPVKFVPDNQEIDIKEDQAALGNAPYMTVNEVRERRGLPPISGGDSVYGNAFLSPIGEPQTDVSKTVKTKSLPSRVKREEVKSDLKERLVESAMKLFKAKQEKEELYAKHKEFVTRVTTFEQKFAKAIKEHDRKQQAKVMARLRGMVKAVKKGDILDVEEEVKNVIDFATPILGDLVIDEGTRILLGLDSGETVDFVISKRLEQILSNSIKKMAKSYTNTTLSLLSEQINAGISGGESIDQISDRIGYVYDLTDEYRAERVARTEVFSAANDASREAYIQSDVVQTVKWVTAEDELTCEYCGPLDGKIVGVKEGFFPKGDAVDGGDGGEYNLDYESIKNPPLHPNCRCFIQPDRVSIKTQKQIEDEEEKILDTIIKEIE